MKTDYIKASEVDKKWFLVDAEDKTLGRLSSEVAQILRVKGKVKVKVKVKAKGKSKSKRKSKSNFCRCL